jgi:hypothetical protein
LTRGKAARVLQPTRRIEWKENDVLIVVGYQPLTIGAENEAAARENLFSSVMSRTIIVSCV